MRLFFIICCLFVNISSASAEPMNYNSADNHQQRMVPSNQYNNGSVKSTNNGRIAKEPPSRFLGSPDYELNTGIEAGYRTSELKWNVGGDGVSVPNILSELKWESVNGYEVKPSIEYTRKTGALKGLNLQASINKSITTSGKNQDSDYAGNNRTGEFSRSNNGSDAGHSEGFSASVGYAFNFSDDHRKNITRFTALVGYAMQNQKFVIRDGFQTIPAIGPISDLRSSYDMELSMPFIGAELYSRFADVHSIELNAQISKGIYNGTGRWNLRTDFAHPVSFKQDADGHGFLVGAKYGWNIYPRTQFTLATNFNYFKATDGTDIVYLADGTTSAGGFREARFISMDYLAGINYNF